MSLEEGPSRYLDQGGLRPLAELLHHRFGEQIICPTCGPPQQLLNGPSVKAHCKDQGGNAGVEGQQRRQWRCRNSIKRRRETGTGCSILACSGYIRLAVATIGEEKVDTVRQRVYRERKAQDQDCHNIARRFEAEKGAKTALPQRPPVTGKDEPLQSLADSDRKRPSVTIARTPPLKRRRDASVESATRKRQCITILDDSPPPTRALPKPTSPPQRRAVQSKGRFPHRRRGTEERRLEPPKDRPLPEKKRERWESPSRLLDEVYRRVQSLTDLLQRSLQKSAAAPFQSDCVIPDSTDADEGVDDVVDTDVEFADDDSELDWLLASPKSSQSIGYIIDTRPSPEIPASPEQSKGKPQRISIKYGGQSKADSKVGKK